MKLLTLFNAFERAESKKAAALSARGDNFGIAVRDDRYALVWQRYERLAFKLDQRIRKMLGEPRFEDPTCWFCGYPEYTCRDSCPGRKP